MIRETDLIHFSLNVTSMMKKSYKKEGEDTFDINDFNVISIHLHRCSLSSLNLQYIQMILKYLCNVQEELVAIKQASVTYNEIRDELRRRKAKSFYHLKNELHIERGI